MLGFFTAGRCGCVSGGEARSTTLKGEADRPPPFSFHYRTGFAYAETELSALQPGATTLLPPVVAREYNEPQQSREGFGNPGIRDRA